MRPLTGPPSRRNSWRDFFITHLRTFVQYMVDKRCTFVHTDFANGEEQRTRATAQSSHEARTRRHPPGAGFQRPERRGALYGGRGSVGNRERSSGRRKNQKRKLARQEGAPAKMALYESAGRKAAGDGDESAARVDARNEQPVNLRAIPNFVSDQSPILAAGTEAKRESG